MIILLLDKIEAALQDVHGFSKKKGAQSQLHFSIYKPYE